MRSPAPSSPVCIGDVRTRNDMHLGLVLLRKDRLHCLLVALECHLNHLPLSCTILEIFLQSFTGTFVSSAGLAPWGRESIHGKKQLPK